MYENKRENMPIFITQRPTTTFLLPNNPDDPDGLGNGFGMLSLNGTMSLRAKEQGFGDEETGAVQSVVINLS